MDMNVQQSKADEQAALWNGVAGTAWVDMQRLLDGIFAPLEIALLDALPTHARSVLDVGCGTGATTLAIAGRLGEGGSCTGIDVSEPMLALARARAERAGVRAEFTRADAQRHAFSPGIFDAIASRLGVMFFDDPVAAFGNLRRAARTGGTLHCIAWRGAAENPFMTAAERGAASLLPHLAPREANGPGQFAFADPGYVRGLLVEAGWHDAVVRPLDRTCAFATAELVPYLTRLGPLGRVLPTIDGAMRARVVDAALDAFAPHVHGEEVSFNAACWIIEARA